jgi:hypothetical protein
VGGGAQDGEVAGVGERWAVRNGCCLVRGSLSELEFIDFKNYQNFNLRYLKITPMLKLVHIKFPSWEGARRAVKWQGWVRGGPVRNGCCLVCGILSEL